jgi:hypothetical protein
MFRFSVSLGTKSKGGRTVTKTVSSGVVYEYEYCDDHSVEIVRESNGQVDTMAEAVSLIRVAASDPSQGVMMKYSIEHPTHKISTHGWVDSFSVLSSLSQL